VIDQSRQLAAAGLLAIAVAFGFARYGYGLFVPEFRDTFDLSTEAVGFIAAGAYASYLAALLVTGALIARVGPRLPVVIGGLSAAAGMAMIALAPNTPVFVAGVLLAATSPGWSWAPFSDAVARMIDTESQSRTLSIITTGTTFGVLVAGPAALVAGGAWRGAWIAFAVVALAVTAWNAYLLPTGPHGEGDDEGSSAKPELQWRWFIGPKSVRLFAVATSFGFAGTVYWTYAVDLVSGAGGFPASAGPLLWTAVGFTGIAGVATGDMISRLGLRLSMVAALTALGVATGVLGAAPTSWVALGISAALFGSSFMALSALLVTWTSTVFPDQPGTGFSATQVFLAVGTIIGPALMGVVASRFGMETVFIVTGLLALSTALVKPNEEVHSAMDEDSARSGEREGS
jgi:predicted MFS family arabinose efflux permease